MDTEIESFLKEQKNLSFCTSLDNIPYCASCFYAYIKDGNFLVFKSGRNTKHICDALVNDRVAGTIIPDISNLGLIKGIQFTGIFKIPDRHFLKSAQSIYYGKYPFARPMPGELWGIELVNVKMTSNRLGFAKKIYWEKIKSNDEKNENSV